MKGRTYPSPSAVLSSRIQKRYPFTAKLTERDFQSSDGEARVQTHNFPATFCVITERLQPLGHSAFLQLAWKQIF